MLPSCCAASAVTLCRCVFTSSSTGRLSAGTSRVRPSYVFFEKCPAFLMSLFSVSMHSGPSILLFALSAPSGNSHSKGEPKMGPAWPPWVPSNSTNTLYVPFSGAV